MQLNEYIVDYLFFSKQSPLPSHYKKFQTCRKVEGMHNEQLYILTLFTFCCVRSLSCGVVWYDIYISYHIIYIIFIVPFKISCRHLDTSLALSPKVMFYVTITSLSHLALVSSFNFLILLIFYWLLLLGLFCWYFIFLTSLSTVVYPELHHWTSSLLYSQTS